MSLRFQSEISQNDKIDFFTSMCKCVIGFHIFIEIIRLKFEIAFVK